MRALSCTEVLSIWERGCNCSLVDQALLILSAARPDVPFDSLAQLSIGQRDAELLQLRARTFGPQFDCRTNCPQCRQDLEFRFEASQLRANAFGDSSQTRMAEIDGCQVRYRAPNSEDLRVALNSPDIAAGKTRILRRCVLDIRQRGLEKPIAELPEAVLDRIGDLIVHAEPSADLQIEIQCRECGSSWVAPFDIVSFLWQEISAWARRCLWEVHAIAAAYGWSEAEILAMSPMRRQLYLEMASA